MSAEVSIDVDGVDKVVQKLSDMLIRGKAFTPIFAKQIAELKLAWAGNFTSGGFVSGGWAPLDAGYGAWKLAHFPGAPPMVRTGRLFQSLAVGAAESIYSSTNSSFSIGTTVEYAKFHQYGTTKMPKRQIVFAPEELRRKFASDAADWIVRGEI